MYSTNEIKELISILESSSLSLLELQKEDGSRIKLEKPQQVVSQTISTPTQTVEKVVPVEEKTVATDNAITINSPIVGVFYSSSTPGGKPLVTVGKTISKGDSVCIIEAMKCMNEIQSEISGEVTEILVADGDLVEYGQPLFKVK